MFKRLGFTLFLLANGSFMAAPGQMSERTVATLRGEVADHTAEPGQALRVEVSRAGDDRAVAYATVEPNGRFEFRELPVGMYRVRLLNIQNEAMTEQWVTLTQASEEMTISLPKMKGWKAGTGVVSAKALAIKPSKAAQKAFRKAVKASEKKDYARAATLLEEAVAECPEFAQARSNLAVQYIRLERLAEAQEQLEKAIATGVEDGVIYANLAYVLAARQQFETALQVARRAVEMDPLRTSTRYILASILVRNREQVGEAIPHLAAAAEDFPQARYMLAAIYAERRELASASRELRRYLEGGDARHRTEALRLKSFLDSRR